MIIGFIFILIALAAKNNPQYKGQKAMFNMVILTGVFFMLIGMVFMVNI